MRIIPCGAKYDSKIYVDDQTKIILKLDCQCWNFVNRRIKKIGELADTKYYAEPCKHLKLFVERLEKQGYEIKKPKELIGDDKITNELRKKLLERANNRCECGCRKDYALEVHRKTRGSNGGKYNMENCMVLTKECHQMRHSGEFK